LANQPFVGTGPSSVALFGTGAVNVDGGELWGVNTNISDREFRAAQAPGTHNRRITGYESDISVSYPDTDATGMFVAGNSVVQPNNSTGFAVLPQDFSAATPGSIAKWTQAFFSFNGAAQHFAVVGTTVFVPSGGGGITTNSQDIQMGAFIGGTPFTEQLYFGTNALGNTITPALNTNFPLVTMTGGITARSTLDEVVQLGGHNALSSGGSILARNDTGSAIVPLEVLGNPILLNSGTLQVNNGISGITNAVNCHGAPTSGFTTVNGIVTAC
jgi:hypothetical protein